MLNVKIILHSFICNSIFYMRGGRCRDILLDLNGNNVETYSLGMGTIMNKQAKWYSLFTGLEISVSMGLKKVIVLGDSLLVIS